MAEKVKAFKSSDGQLFTDVKALAQHELAAVIIGSLPLPEDDASIAAAKDIALRVSAGIIAKHAEVFSALKLLKTPTKRKAKTTAATGANKPAGK